MVTSDYIQQFYNTFLFLSSYCVRDCHASFYYISNIGITLCKDIYILTLSLILGIPTNIAISAHIPIKYG